MLVAYISNSCYSIKTRILNHSTPTVYNYIEHFHSVRVKYLRAAGSHRENPILKKPTDTSPKITSPSLKPTNPSQEHIYPNRGKNYNQIRNLIITIIYYNHLLQSFITTSTKDFLPIHDLNIRRFASMAESKHRGGLKIRNTTTIITSVVVFSHFCTSQYISLIYQV